MATAPDDGKTRRPSSDDEKIADDGYQEFAPGLADPDAGLSEEERAAQV